MTERTQQGSGTGLDRSRTRVFEIGRYRVSYDENAEQRLQWSCECRSFDRSADGAAACPHVAAAVEIVMEETTDKLYWHTQSRR